MSSITFALPKSAFAPSKVGLSYRPDLDGLRALSCLLVYFFHVRGSKGWHGQFPVLDYLQGWIGVYVFFVLSGFLITTMLMTEEAERGKIRFGSFILRREFRIVPAYFATIALYGILCLTPIARQYASQYRAGFWWWISYNGDVATLMPSVGSLLGHSWSLAVEQRFYLIWPFLLFAISRSWRARLAILTVGVVGSLYIPFTNPVPYFALMIGSTVAVANGYGLGERFLSRIPMAFSITLAMGSFVVVWRHLSTLPLFCVMTGLLVLHLTVRETWFKSLLEAKGLVWLGQRSYSFYLLHVICLNIVLKILPTRSTIESIGAIVAGCTLTMIAAATSYQLIEEPFRKLGKRILN